MITIDNKKCDKCGTCVSVCPANAIILENVLRITDEQCVGCDRCVTVCPVGALSKK